MRVAVVLLLVGGALVAADKGKPATAARSPKSRSVSCKPFRILTGSHGGFGTRRSPYGNNERCFWYIRVPRHKRLKLHFTKFDLENHSRCLYDNVTVAGGVRGHTYCGHKTPADYVYPGRSASVRFRTDSSVTFRGFYAVYSAVSCNILDIKTGYYDRKNIGTLGPHYENNEYCSWRFTAPYYWHVTIKRLSFNLEQQADCHYDYVKIYDGTSNKAPLRGTYCGTNFPNFLMSTGRSFFIEFKSDSTVTKPGFLFSVWRSVDGPG